MAQENLKSKIKIIHTNLINELIKGHVGQNPKSNSYDRWKGGFKKYCDQTVQFDNSVRENFDYLEETDQVSPGKYAVLIDIFSGDRQAIEKIEEAETKIQDISRKGSLGRGNRPIQVADPSAAYGNNNEVMNNRSIGQPTEAQAADENMPNARVRVVFKDEQISIARKMSVIFRKLMKDLRSTLPDPQLSPIEIGYNYAHGEKNIETECCDKMDKALDKLKEMLRQCSTDNLRGRSKSILKLWFAMLLSLEKEFKVAVYEFGWNDDFVLFVNINLPERMIQNLKMEVASQFRNIFASIEERNEVTPSVYVEILLPADVTEQMRKLDRGL